MPERTSARICVPSTLGGGAASVEVGATTGTDDRFVAGRLALCCVQMAVDGLLTGARIPQRNAALIAPGTAAVPVSPGRAARDRPPSARAPATLPSSVTTTVPSRSVRNTSALRSRSRSIVAGAGWPYGLPAPAETAAIRGRTASRNAPVDDVRLP